ncbi:MAG: phage terminase small subunit P27 family [Deltaproteobacteria bacterium]|nr:MAG: phage terminase small subunit P27 family [Deltaproteobacteria bacterium]
MEPIKRLWQKPSNLTGYGAEFYKRVGKQLLSVGVLTELDRESFAALAGAFHLMQASLDAVNESGVNVRGSQDEVKKNPALTTYKNASDIYHRLSRKFFLTPGDREGVKIEKPKQADNGKGKFFD